MHSLCHVEVLLLLLSLCLTPVVFTPPLATTTNTNEDNVPDAVGNGDLLSTCESKESTTSTDKPESLQSEESRPACTEESVVAEEGNAELETSQEEGEKSVNEHDSVGKKDGENREEGGKTSEKTIKGSEQNRTGDGSLETFTGEGTSDSLKEDKPSKSSLKNGNCNGGTNEGDALGSDKVEEGSGNTGVAPAVTTEGEEGSPSAAVDERDILSNTNDNEEKGSKDETIIATTNANSDGKKNGAKDVTTKSTKVNVNGGLEGLCNSSGISDHKNDVIPKEKPQENGPRGPNMSNTRRPKLTKEELNDDEDDVFQGCKEVGGEMTFFFSSGVYIFPCILLGWPLLEAEGHLLRPTRFFCCFFVVFVMDNRLDLRERRGFDWQGKRGLYCRIS